MKTRYYNLGVFDATSIVIVLCLVGLGIVKFHEMLNSLNDVNTQNVFGVSLVAFVFSIIIFIRIVYIYFQTTKQITKGD
jgi:hypothetical protein